MTTTIVCDIEADLASTPTYLALIRLSLGDGAEEIDGKVVTSSVAGDVLAWHLARMEETVAATARRLGFDVLSTKQNHEQVLALYDSESEHGFIARLVAQEEVWLEISDTTLQAPEAGPTEETAP